VSDTFSLRENRPSVHRVQIQPRERARVLRHSWPPPRDLVLPLRYIRELAREVLDTSTESSHSAVLRTCVPRTGAATAQVSVVCRCEQADQRSGHGADVVKSTQSFFCRLGWLANDAGVGVAADAEGTLGNDDRVRCGWCCSSPRARTSRTDVSSSRAQTSSWLMLVMLAGAYFGSGNKAPPCRMATQTSSPIDSGHAGMIHFLG
jgi:hypothetical protein